jgi:basic membrane protein A and related proteins
VRSKWVKYGALVLAVALVGAMIAGCSGGSTSGSGTTTEPAKTDVKAAMVTDIGGLGDKSFNDLSAAGLKKAEKDLGVQIQVVESKAPTDYESNLTQLANSGYNPIFAVGFLMTDTVVKVAPTTPDVTYGGIDEFFDPTIPNVVGITFKEAEAGYLAGVLAGSLTSQTNVDPRINDKLIIGFVGGMEIPPVQAYQAGYIAGAKKANPAVEVKSIYTGSFTDQQKGFEAGKALIEQGADIVFAAAGQTGLGTAKACQENKALFIGVDSDQFLTIPAIGDTIITSAIKKIDVAVFETIKKAVDGTLKGGVNEALGIKEDAVGLAPYHDWDSKVPAETKKMVDDAKAEIAAGTVTVPSK